MFWGPFFLFFNTLSYFFRGVPFREHGSSEKMLIILINNFHQEPQSASVVASFNMTEDLDLSTVCTTTDECFLTFSATDADGSPAAPDNFILLGEPRDAPLLPANVQV